MALIEPSTTRSTIHSAGLPTELTGGNDTRTRMAWPRVILSEEEPDGIFLHRFTAEADFAGDTWHRTREEAKNQAHFEYGESPGDWKRIPDHVKNAVAYALRNRK